MSDQQEPSRTQAGGDNGKPIHAKPGELRPSPPTTEPATLKCPECHSTEIHTHSEHDHFCTHCGHRWDTSPPEPPTRPFRHVPLIGMVADDESKNAVASLNEYIELAEAYMDHLDAEHARLMRHVSAASTKLAEAVAEVAEHRASFDLRWKADMRAIEKWHDAGGDALTWPDHADLCTWLMTRLADYTGRIEAASRIIEIADTRCQAVDGPVSRIRDEMHDSEWRQLYLVITEKGE